MRESLMYGSVRGTRGNSRPYRDGMFMAAFWHDSQACETIPLTGVKRTALLRRGNACK